MSKFSGIKLAAFIVGVVIPLSVTMWLLDRFIEQEPEVVYVSTESLVASDIELFAVDYDMYGTSNIGESFIRCDIMNNTMNMTSCKIWLEEEGTVITEVLTLRPSQHALVLQEFVGKEVVGEYKVELIYEVYNEDSVSRITCPYIILINGGE